MHIELQKLKKSYPKGWHLKQNFVDQFGNIWVKGSITTVTREFLTHFKMDDVDVTKDGIAILGEESNEVNTTEEIKEQPKVEKEIYTEKPSKSNTNEDVENLKRMVLELQNQLIKQGVEPKINNTILNVEEKAIPFGDPIKESETNEDYGDEVTYFMYGRGMPLSSYKIGDKIHVSPTNQPIPFVYESTLTNRTGREEETMHFSRFSTRNNKIKEFVERCPLYGMKIFKSMGEAAKKERLDVTRIENVVNWVESMKREELMTVCERYGISLEQKVSDMKLKLQQIRLQEIYQEEIKRQETMVAKNKVYLENEL